MTPTRTQRSTPALRVGRAVAAGAAALGCAFSAWTPSATAAPPAHEEARSQYTAEIVGTRATPSPYAFGATALGISKAGEVLVRSSSGGVTVATPERSRSLASADGLAAYPAVPQTMSPTGAVYGAGISGFFRWDRNGITFRPLGDGTAYYPPTAPLANSRGDIAGCLPDGEVSAPYLGSFGRSTIGAIAWPASEPATCQATGLSERGVATVTQWGPSFDDGGMFPRAVTVTRSGVTPLRTPPGVKSTADAISPGGRYVVGRTYHGEQATVSWLSTRREPVELEAAGAMTPRFVTDRGQVLGTDGNRVVAWQDGRRSDLTQDTALPRGWVLTQVAGVNRAGQIAATAKLPGTVETVAVRLTPRRPH